MATGTNHEVAETVVAINDNINNMNVLPVGSTILIPRPTSTATAVGAGATQAALATIGVDDASGAILPSGATVGCYEVESGDSIVAIAERYSTLLWKFLSQLNQALNWAGCAFTEPSGGPDCKPNIQIGQCVNVPLPTPLAQQDANALRVTKLPRLPQLIRHRVLLYPSRWSCDSGRTAAIALGWYQVE